MLVTWQPEVIQAVPPAVQIFFASGVTLGAASVIVLNLVFHFSDIFQAKSE